MFKTDDAYFSLLVRAESRALVVDVLSRVADLLDERERMGKQTGYTPTPPSVSGAIRTALKEVITSSSS